MKISNVVLPALILGVASAANAQLITSSAGISNPTVINFSQFNSGYDFTAGPVQVGGLVGQNVTYSSTTSNSVIGNGGYGFANNGYWDGAFSYVGVNSPSDAITFTFNNGPVSAVGGFINYAPDYYGDAIIQALNSSDQVIDTADLTNVAPISTPGETDAGAFRGFQDSTADISALRISGAYISLTDLTFSSQTAGTPEPGAFALIGGLGISGLGFLRRRRAALKV